MRTWSQKTVAVIGFGQEGQAVTDYLVQHGAVVTVCDERDEVALHEALTRYQGMNIHWQLGPSYLKGLEKFSVIVRSPGVPLSLASLKRATAKGIEVTSLTKLFFELCPAPIIGVTGTKGKGTTTTLIAEMLLASRKKVHVVGNIGKPGMAILPTIRKTDWVVYELSSFQLQDLTLSPQIAVVLGLTPEHLDYHKNVREYYEAKANIVKFQKLTDAAVLMIDYPETKKFERYLKGRLFETSRREAVKNGACVLYDTVVREMFGKTEEIIAANQVGLRGAHNLENVTSAVVAATLAGATLPAIRSVLKTFRGLPHRLEPVGEVGGVQFWNNSYGTTPETTIAAARAFHEPIILLLGGSEKGHTYEKLGEALVDTSVKAIIGIGMTAPKMYAAINVAAKAKNKKPPIFVEGGKTMTEMIRAARKFAKAGDIVLLAPGAASFDRFKNYTERGELFCDVVKKLTAKT